MFEEKNAIKMAMWSKRIIANLGFERISAKKKLRLEIPNQNMKAMILSGENS